MGVLCSCVASVHEFVMCAILCMAALESVACWIYSSPTSALRSGRVAPLHVGSPPPAARMIRYSPDSYCYSVFVSDVPIRPDEDVLEKDRDVSFGAFLVADGCAAHRVTRAQQRTRSLPCAATLEASCSAGLPWPIIRSRHASVTRARGFRSEGSRARSFRPPGFLVA